MERKEDTPLRKTRRKYEEKNKEKRKQASGTFGTMIPRTLFDEINTFLEENGITKVQLVKEGYEALKSKKENVLWIKNKTVTSQVFCVVKSIDKEIIITENNTTNKKFLIDRLEYVRIGDTVYRVSATEKEGAKETPLDIMRRLIDRKTENLINEERTCYLRANGGKK